MRGILVFLLVVGCRDEVKETGGEDTSRPVAIDEDNDGYSVSEDCDDADSSIHPNAVERCDDVDNDCDGLVDDEDPQVVDADEWYLDFDLDGYGGDQLTLIACEQPDGYVDNHLDCQDADGAVHPDAVESCDGVDNDCDGVVDGSDATDGLTWYSDLDGDGYGTTDTTVTACDPPAGFALHDGDCDDADPAYNPGALELDCSDPEDYNCDGSTGYDDADADGFAACEDCDDSDASANDDAAEICDGIDNDCDGDIDGDDGSLSDATTFYGDSDGDGYGGSQYQAQDCSAPPGFVANSDDCDDLDATSHPGASEVCDDADNDCDNDVDEGVGSTWYEDSDSDGYGNGSVSSLSCNAPSGYVGNALDCDDFSSSTNPGSFEVCDSVDNDCDGSVDEDAINATDFYVDADNDGYGSAASSVSSCTAQSGYADNDADCNDGDSAVNPAATESCDSIDNDCDGTIDESGASGGSTWYQDLDSDGFGNPANDVSACTQPSGYVADATDCDDTSVSINTSGTEICDLKDNDCDGTVDENDATDATTWYADTDLDNYGDLNSTITACSQTSGYVSDSSDCNDSDSSVYPGATETWYDGIDSDCGGDNDNDADGDGLESYSDAGGTDCNDADANESACGTSASTALPSCNELLTADSSLGTSTYWIDPDGGSTSNAFEAYCDMTTDGGGWTLCLSNVGRGKGVALADTNDWWITTWDQGSTDFTRGNRDQGSSWGNFCGDMAAESTEIFATIYSETNSFTQSDICTFNPNWFTPGSGHMGLTCGGNTTMSAFPKNGYNNQNCTNCMYKNNSTTPNTDAAVWSHNFYGTHVIIKPQNNNAYGSGAIHWGNVNTGMSSGNAGDVHCGEAGGWCYEDYWYGDKAWKKSMQLYLR